MSHHHFSCCDCGQLVSARYRQPGEPETCAACLAMPGWHEHPSVRPRLAPSCGPGSVKPLGLSCSSGGPAIRPGARVSVRVWDWQNGEFTASGRVVRVLANEACIEFDGEFLVTVPVGDCQIAEPVS